MLGHIKCERCGGKMITLSFEEDGERYIDCLECYNCWIKEIISIMTVNECRKVFEDYNNGLSK